MKINKFLYVSNCLHLALKSINYNKYCPVNVKRHLLVFHQKLFYSGIFKKEKKQTNLPSCFQFFMHPEEEKEENYKKKLSN